MRACISVTWTAYVHVNRLHMLLEGFDEVSLRGIDATVDGVHPVPNEQIDGLVVVADLANEDTEKILELIDVVLRLDRAEVVVEPTASVVLWCWETVSKSHGAASAEAEHSH